MNGGNARKFAPDMAGIYLHIPFCRQACHYCDFHFSTNAAIQPQLVEAMAKEIVLRTDYLEGKPLETVYFGGGTPSLLEAKELELLMSTLRDTHNLLPESEITLEANPDDITVDKLQAWRSLGINRLSIGIQSFDDLVLKYLNRVHCSATATRSIERARAAGFENFSIDMMYAIPGQRIEDWEENLNQAVALNPPHISAYTLTIEEKTVFGSWTARGKMKAVDERAAAEQLETLMEKLSTAGYRQYEISNFAYPGYESRHNSSYWSGLPYLGIGPSAHSYNLETRQFNVASNHLYIRALREEKIPAETEVLTKRDHVNEYILTTLRTDLGCNLHLLKQRYGYDLLADYGSYLTELRRHQLVTLQDQFLRLTPSGRLLADKISSDLFYDGDQ